MYKKEEGSEENIQEVEGRNYFLSLLVEKDTQRRKGR